MLKCRDVSRLIAADEVRTAGFGRRVAVHAHLMMCSHCRRFAHELELLGRALRTMSGDEVGHSSDSMRLDDAEAVARVMRRLPPHPPAT